MMADKTAQKKILFLITKGNWGGAQKYVFDLATNLPTDKFLVSVICGRGIALKQKLEAAGIKTVVIDRLGREIRLWSDIITFFKLIKIFWQEKPEIIHLNSSKAGVLGALAGRLTGVPKIIFTAHGWTFNERRNYLTKIIVKSLHWLTVWLSHTTIAVSEKMRANLAFWPLIKNRFKVIYNGWAAGLLIDRETARQKLAERLPPPNRLNRKAIWLGTIAELHDNKGLDIAIAAVAKAIKNNPELVYIIIGEGEERLRLEKLIKNYHLIDHVFLTGFMAAADQYLQAFDIFILPSRTEALSYVLLEAGGAGLPVIATAVGGVPEIIDDQKTGWLTPAENPEALAKAIATAIADKDRRRTYGQALKEKVEAKFTLKQMIKQTRLIYES